MAPSVEQGGSDTHQAPLDAGTAQGWRPWRDLGHALGFFTVLPLSGSGSLSEIAGSSYLLPLVALLLGVLEGATAWGAEWLFGAPVAAALTLAVALLLTGFHHTDGLADLGDALMAHGDAARRIEVLKDRSLGTGAAGALLLVYLISWAALTQIFLLRPGSGAELLLLLIAAEVAARLCLLLVASLGRPSHQGSGSSFIALLKGWRGIAGVVVSLLLMALLALLAPPLAVLLATCGVLAVALLILLVSWRLLGGVGGDVLGASVELGRMAALLGIAAALLHAAG